METTMFEVGVVAQFEAAHRLRGDFGPATRRHGHTYRVEVRARGQTLRPDGTLFDIARLQEALRDVTAALHYRDLDEVPELAQLNTTAEALAHYVFTRIAQRGIFGQACQRLGEPTHVPRRQHQPFAVVLGQVRQVARPPADDRQAIG